MQLQPMLTQAEEAMSGVDLRFWVVLGRCRSVEEGVGGTNRGESYAGSSYCRAGRGGRGDADHVSVCVGGGSGEV